MKKYSTSSYHTFTVEIALFDFKGQRREHTRERERERERGRERPEKLEERHEWKIYCSNG